RNLVRDLWPEYNDKQRSHTDCRCIESGCVEVREVSNPLLNEIGRHRSHLQAEEVLDLRRKDHECNATGETHDQRIRNELDHRAKSRESHQHEQDTCHEGCNDESVNAMQLHNPIHDHNKRSGRSTNLNTTSSKRRDEKASNDGCHQSLLGRHTRCDSKCNCQRKRYNSHNDAGKQVFCELLPVIRTKGIQKFRPEHTLAMSGFLRSKISLKTIEKQLSYLDITPLDSRQLHRVVLPKE